MIGKIFITRKGYDPQLGRRVKDPYLGDAPSIGACRPDFRRQLKPGDHLFVISGRIQAANQFVMGGFEVEEKISAVEAYHRFPDQRLRELPDGQLVGNVIIDRNGHQHPLDDHKNFNRRIENYIVGTNPIALQTAEEIRRGREETLEALQEILKRRGATPFQVVTRFGRTLNEDQVNQLRSWLGAIKIAAR